MSRLLVSCRLAPYSETPLLAVRHGAETVEADGVWRESFGPGAFLAGGRNAEVQFGHDSAAIGSVVTIAAHDGWYYADLIVESDDPEVLARIRVGTPVSAGARILTRSTDTDLDLRIRRHGLAQLQHIAIARRGELAGYRGAQIVGVRESKIAAGRSKANGRDWRAMLPPDWADFRDDKIDLQPGDTLLKGGQRGGIVWDGHKFARTAARLAA